MTVTHALALALTQRHKLLQTLLALHAGVAMRNLWMQYGTVEDSERFLNTAVPYSLQVQLHAAMTTGTYLDLMSERRHDYDAEHFIGADVRNGATPDDVYRRPMIVARIALGAGALWLDAMNRAADRAEQLARTDAALAQRAAMREIASGDKGIIGYRRVLSAGCCNFCALASDQLYHTDELMPLHPSCTCSVSPVYREDDPATAINDAALEATDVARDAAVETVEHGELGPLLHDPRDDFSELGDI